MNCLQVKQPTSLIYSEFQQMDRKYTNNLTEKKAQNYK